MGLSAPHVNRMLAELKSEGLIAIKRHEVKILDMAALQILGEFHPAYLARTPILERGRGGFLVEQSNVPIRVVHKGEA